MLDALAMVMFVVMLMVMRADHEKGLEARLGGRPRLVMVSLGEEQGVEGM